MIVATRDLSETLPGGVVVTHSAGAVLDRFTKWDYAVQLAMRRMGYVADKPEDVAAASVQPTHDDQGSAGGYSCPHCPGRSFVNHQGLKLHTTRTHGPGATPKGD